MAKQSSRQRFVQRWFDSKGININKHPVITGLLLEGEAGRVIGFTSSDVLPCWGPSGFEHPCHKGVHYKVEGATFLFDFDGVHDVGLAPTVTPTTALKSLEVEFIDSYQFLDMLQRAEELKMIEFDPECVIYFCHKEV